MKIESPKDGQDIRAGDYLTVKYVMQPLIKSTYTIIIHNDAYTCAWLFWRNASIDQVSMGKALSLDINFHSRKGNKKQQQLGAIHKSWYAFLLNLELLLQCIYNADDE